MHRQPHSSIVSPPPALTPASGLLESCEGDLGSDMDDCMSFFLDGKFDTKGGTLSEIYISYCVSRASVPMCSSQILRVSHDVH